MSTRRLTFPAIALTLALALSGCAPGGDEESPAPSDGGGGGGSSEPILIGSAMPLTGPYASDGEEMLQALELAIADYNAAGGVLGRQLELVTCDVAALEVDTIQACGERILGENPDAVITGYDDSGINTLAFGEGDMPYLHAVTMTAAVDPVRDDPEKYSNVFQYDPSDYDYGVNAAEILPQIAEQLGFSPTNKSVAVITTDYAYNVVGAEAFKDFIADQGYEIAVDEVTPFGVEEWGPILSRIEAAEPAFVTFWNLDPSDAARFMNQWDAQFGDGGLNSLVYMQYTPSIPEFLELSGDSAEGLLWATVIGVSDRIGLDKADYTAKWVEEYGGEPKSIHAYVVRDAFDIWANAVEAVGCVDCFDQVNDSIRETIYQGYAGTYDFAPLEEGQYAQAGDDLLPTLWSQVQGGKNVVVLPDNAAEGEIQLPPWLP
ncbi:MAG TPA: ABC transporter substrate-binding protein [Candidatus Limnocylindrales bacterium]|nr:ABC transporter substrate-binding protein [Candidatus Limnocylindrales bacterium]